MAETKTPSKSGRSGKGGFKAPRGADSQTTTPKKSEKIDPSFENKLLSGRSAELEEEIVDPLSIINKATGGASFDRLPDQDDDESDRQYNDLEQEENVMDTGVQSGVKPIPLDELDEALPVLPQIRKVVIKKIDRFVFKMGLEKLKEKTSLMPGASHGWVCDKKGDSFVTGFDLTDEKGNLIYAKDRQRLEKALNHDLGPKSNFWATLSYKLEAKPHGMIMNFDDPVLGAFNEVVYFGMLGSSMIANGLQEYTSGKKPGAEWYIENKDAEAELKQKEITTEQDAYDAYREMSAAKRRGAAKLLGLPAWGANDRIVNAILWDYLKGIDTNGQRIGTPVKNCENFLKVAEQGGVEFETRVTVRDGVKLNVIRKNRLGQLAFGDVELGPSEDTAVQRLVLPTNSNVLRAIKLQITQKAR